MVITMIATLLILIIFYLCNYYTIYYSEQNISHVTLQTLHGRYHGEQYTLTTPWPIREEDTKEKTYKTE